MLTAASVPFTKVIGILAVLFLLGCQEDLAPLSAKWASKASTYSTEIETLKKRHDGLKARVHAIDPAGKAGASKASLEQALKVQNEEFVKLDQAMAHARAMVDVAKKGGKRDSMLTAPTTTRATPRRSRAPISCCRRKRRPSSKRSVRRLRNTAKSDALKGPRSATYSPRYPIPLESVGDDVT